MKLVEKRGRKMSAIVNDESRNFACLGLVSFGSVFQLGGEASESFVGGFRIRDQIDEGSEEVLEESTGAAQPLVFIISKIEGLAYLWQGGQGGNEKGD
jgi:hypothetical protein